MNQKELMELLQEAAKPNCSLWRRNEIGRKLYEASPATREDGALEIDGREAGMQLILSSLYQDTLENRPALLPMMFPVFAMICGDRQEGMICANVDWSLI